MIRISCLDALDYSNYSDYIKKDMDKNTIIGFVLIGLVLFVFSWLNQPTPEQAEAQRRYQDSIAKIEYAQQAELQTQKSTETPLLQQNEADDGLPDSARMIRLQNNYGVFAAAMQGTDGYTVLENDKLEIRLSNRGGRVAYARLKEHTAHDGQPLVLFDEKESAFDFTLITANNRVVNTRDMYFTPVKGSEPNTVVMRLPAGEEGFLDFTYRLKSDDYILDYSIQAVGLNGILSPSTTSLDFAWQQDIRQQEKGRKFEDRYTALYYKYAADNVENLSESADASQKLSNRLKWIGYKDMYFSTVLIANGEGFESSTLESKKLSAEGYLKHYKTTASIPFDLQGGEASAFQFYFGPNLYPLLKSYDSGMPADQRLEMEKMVTMGASFFRWINRYFILPVFGFLGKFIDSYGLIILLLTLIVKLILFPLTYKSYMSTAKMRVLRPQVEELSKKYPGQDKAMERQKATMDLYSRAGASPMSGCVPMLLQMPILISLYMFFPSAFELRHESFLWVKDLSTYDAIASWNTYIPFITPYFGNHISLFCLLMTATQIVYTKFNMDMNSTGQQKIPGMKMMMYMMPLMMMFFFNEYAAGLTYYYFISTLITIGQTLFFRYTINEEKLLAKLEMNKRKPQKKSGLMKRLEDAQKLQEERLRQQKVQRKK
ncbi:Oxa1Ec [Bacteroidales bacterium Barb7]|nr:Oxa1Ec [Bacteroidales bacterium Barb7]